MIGFGELRRLSVQWHADIAAVERAYCIDWLIKGIFDQADLARTLTLRGSAALRYAYFPDYSAIEEPEFLATMPPEDTLRGAVESAEKISGLKFSLIDFTRTSAKVEYTGPLGRRSAAQPHIVLSFISGELRMEPVRMSLIHRFSDACAATVSALALEEFAAERIAQLAQMPRARDVFDLWFALTHAHGRIEPTRVTELAREIAQAKNIPLPRADALFDPARRASLERSWDNALRRVPDHLSFAEIEKDLLYELENIDSARHNFPG
jgi:predicted nucleotidyltransferase component of viral defense system